MELVQAYLSRQEIKWDSFFDGEDLNVVYMKDNEITKEEIEFVRASDEFVIFYDSYGDYLIEKKSEFISCQPAQIYSYGGS